MNKTELVNAVAEQNSGLAKGVVTNVVNFLDSLHLYGSTPDGSRRRNAAMEH